jgi:hypothetical protein
MWDFVTDKSGAGAGFLRELRFPLSIYIPSVSPKSFYHPRLASGRSASSPTNQVIKNKKNKKWLPECYIPFALEEATHFEPFYGIIHKL